jgi:hypothetical protein
MPEPERGSARPIRQKARFDRLIGLQILYTVLGGIFALMPISIALIDGPWQLLLFAFSGLGQFAFTVGFAAASLGAFCMVAVLAAGSAMAEQAFEIDPATGTTTDAFGRRWVRERHGPAKVVCAKAGPVGIIFPAFDVTEGAASGPPPPRIGGPTRRFLQRGFARLCGARGAEVDGLILPIGYLADREAILAAIKPVQPPLRWW